jgi:hypothetical protein
VTTFNGYLGPAALYGAYSGRPAWLSTVGTWTPTGEAHLVGANAAHGAFTNTQPIALRGAVFSGTVAPGVNTVFYNRILVEPVYIDLGSIVNEQQRDILVFNGYLTGQTLSSVDENSFDSGMSLAGGSAPPMYYFPLQETTYTLTANLSGPPQIAASIDFNWAALGLEITVGIVGSRIVLLPVTFRSRVVETLVWKTDIMVAYAGDEQRVRLRRSPRQQLKVRAYLDRADRNNVENLLIGWRKRIWAVPMWIEARPADSPVTQGDLTIDVDTRWGDFRVDGLAVIWESPTKFDVFQIAGLTDDEITLYRGAGDDYASPVIMPVRSARMTRDPVRTTSGYDGVLSADLEVTDNTYFDPDPSDIQFLGEDFYDMTPLYEEGGDGLDDEYEHRIETLDYGVGVVQQYAPWDHIKIIRSFELVLEGLEQVWEHRMWLHRRAGRLRPFYMTTYENNFTILSEGNIDDSFEAAQNNYVNQGSERNHLAFRLKADGSYVFRTVTGVENLPGGSMSITMDSALNVDAADIDEVSFVGLKRLDSDRLSFTWMANNVALTKVPIKEIEH